MVASAAYSPGGQWIVTASADKTSRIWDANTGTELRILIGHNDRVWSTRYSPGGQRIVTGSLDKTAKVWDTKTGQELMTLTGHDGRVMSAAHSPDGPWIVTASNDGTVQIYTTDMEELLEIAKSRVTRQLTTEEKEKYGGAD